MLSVVEKFLYCAVAHLIRLAAEAMIKLSDQMKQTYQCGD